MDGGFAGAHAWLARNDGPLSPTACLVDYEEDESLFGRLERAHVDQIKFSNASAKEKSSIVMQKLLDKSMTSLTLNKSRLENLTADFDLAEKRQQVKQTVTKIFKKDERPPTSFVARLSSFKNEIVPPKKKEEVKSGETNTSPEAQAETKDTENKSATEETTTEESAKATTEEKKPVFPSIGFKKAYQGEKASQMFKSSMMGIRGFASKAAEGANTGALKNPLSRLRKVAVDSEGGGTEGDQPSLASSWVQKSKSAAAAAARSSKSAAAAAAAAASKGGAVAAAAASKGSAAAVAVASKGGAAAVAVASKGGAVAVAAASKGGAAAAAAATKGGAAAAVAASKSKSAATAAANVSRNVFSGVMAKMPSSGEETSNSVKAAFGRVSDVGRGFKMPSFGQPLMDVEESISFQLDEEEEVKNIAMSESDDSSSIVVEEEVEPAKAQVQRV